MAVDGALSIAADDRAVLPPSSLDEEGRGLAAGPPFATPPFFPTTVLEPLDMLTGVEADGCFAPLPLPLPLLRLAETKELGLLMLLIPLWYSTHTLFGVMPHC